MPTTDTVITEAMTNVAGKGSDVEVDDSEGKGNNNGSKEVEMGLVSGEWSATATYGIPLSYVFWIFH
jgi:hypothetical protein